MNDSNDIKRHLRNGFLVFRLEKLLEPEPGKLRVVQAPYPYHGVVVFAMIGKPNPLEKPIADAIRRGKSFFASASLLERRFFLILNVRNVFLQSKMVAIMAQVSEYCRANNIDSPLIDRWLDSRQRCLYSLNSPNVKYIDQESNSEN